MDSKMLISTDAFELEEVDAAADYTYRGKYKLVNPTTAAHLSSLLQYIPQSAQSLAMNKAYRVEFPKGVAGTLVPHENGFLSVMRGENGKFAGHATFVEMGDYAAMCSVFTALSVATSQYYLHQINQQLTSIQGKLNEVLEFLYSDKACEIYAEARGVYGIYLNYQSIMKCSEQRISALNTVQRAKNIAERNIQFYYRDMNGRLVGKDFKKTERDDQPFDRIKDDLSNYHQAMNLFGLCSLMEIVLSQNFDTGYLKYIQEDLKQHIDTHNITIGNLNGKLQAKLMEKPEGKLVGIFAKTDDSEKINILVEEATSLLSENSPIRKFEAIIKNIESEYTTHAEYRILGDGTVYQKV